MSEGFTAGDKLVKQFTEALGEGEEYDEREVAVLDLARRQANDIEALEGQLEAEGGSVTGSTGQSRLNPIYAELRQQRLALAKILQSVKLPDEGLGSSRNSQQQRAARSRWDRDKSGVRAIHGA
ncbi:hypothetical protein V1639_08905 [Pseudarthrobacter sp. J75]|uniref:hypothetical protein n=1 Tax=Pseudarthrobacter sp. J75 TaxID=3116486 RepID=UPI002E8175AD|nr:hypothetical protein [Pseudarthrobacter sp. J75]MEE2529147.1 hypothetical protein [Pseudarthrobacter sp. J75]